MSIQSTRLPPLNALRVFLAAMRHRSFRGASDELLVTPQAVSQQIKLLEESLAVVLFDRKGRVIEPTEDAIIFARFIEAGFDEFAEGVRRITRSNYRNRVNLNVSPYFATHYLMHRLERFRDRLPGADLRLTTMIDLPDFAADDVDVTIQWGFGTWRDYDCTLLVRDPKIICCAPDLSARIGSAADLLKLTLLHPVLAKSLWGEVLAHLGLDVPNLPNAIQFQDAATMRRAALTGLGVGLISRLDAIEDLRAGRLVAPLGLDAIETMPEDKVPGFYLIVPKAHRRVKSISVFCDWIVGEDWSAQLHETDTP